MSCYYDKNWLPATLIRGQVPRLCTSTELLDSNMKTSSIPIVADASLSMLAWMHDNSSCWHACYAHAIQGNRCDHRAAATRAAPVPPVPLLLSYAQQPPHCSCCAQSSRCAQQPGALAVLLYECLHATLICMAPCLDLHQPKYQTSHRHCQPVPCNQCMVIIITDT